MPSGPPPPAPPAGACRAGAGPMVADESGCGARWRHPRETGRFPSPGGRGAHAGLPAMVPDPTVMWSTDILGFRNIVSVGNWPSRRP